MSSPEGARTGATQAVPRQIPEAPVQLEPIMSQARGAQLSTLSRRAVAVIASDRGLLRMLVLMPLILAALGYAVADASGLGATVGPSGISGNPQARSLLMVFLLGAVFIGTAAAIQEIARERTIYARERAIGLSLAAYLGSKVLVVGLITAAQGAAFVLLALAGRPGPPDPILLGNGKLEIVLRGRAHGCLDDGRLGSLSVREINGNGHAGAGRDHDDPGRSLRRCSDRC